MWNSGPWNQWPIHASMYQNVPHEQVDWAQLAKQWIQMQQKSSEGGQSQPQVLPPTTVMPPLQHAAGLNAPPATGGNFWSSSWATTTDGSKAWAAGAPLPGLGGAPPPPPAVPSVPLLPLPTVAPEGVSSKETFDYGHTSSAPPLSAQSYDYGHGGPEQYETVPQPQPYPNQVPYGGSYWGVGTGPPPFFLRKDRKDSKDESRHPMLEEEVPHIDAAKRKTLPAWIREGLEKMERERQRKQERERAEAERLAKLNKRRGSEDDPSRSKFDTDSEEEEEESSRKEEVSKKTVQERNGTPLSRPSPTPSPPEEDGRFKTPEERQQELMMKVRRMLTELLLVVTTEEMESVAKEVFQRALQKAPARRLNSSSALANIASGLGGLTGYGSDSESSGESSGDDAEDDSDRELERSIREKKLAFAEWEQRTMASLDAADRRLQAEAAFSAQKVTGDEVVHSPTAEEDSPPQQADGEDVSESPRREESSSSPENENVEVDPKSLADDEDFETKQEDWDRQSSEAEKSEEEEEEPQRDRKRNGSEARRSEERKPRREGRRSSTPKRRRRSREKKKRSRHSKSRSRSRSRSRRSRSRSRHRRHDRSRSRSRSRRSRDRKHHRRRSYSSESEGSGKRSSRRYR